MCDALSPDIQSTFPITTHSRHGCRQRASGWKWLLGRRTPRQRGTAHCTQRKVEIFKKNFIGVELIYNVLLVSGVQRSDSVLHIHIYSHNGNFHGRISSKKNDTHEAGCRLYLQCKQQGSGLQFQNVPSFTDNSSTIQNK